MTQSDNNDETLSNDELSIAEDLAAERAQYEYLETKYSSLKEHTRQTQALSAIEPEMLKQDSVGNLLELIANKIVELTKANGAYLYMPHEAADNLSVAASCEYFDKPLIDGMRKQGIDLAATAWEKRRSQYTDDYQPAIKQHAVDPIQLKAVAIPLLFSGKILGVTLVTASAETNLFSQIQFLEEIAKKSAMALYCTAQLESQKKETQRIKAMSLLGETLYQSTDWSVVLTRVSEILFQIFDADRVLFYQESPIDGQLNTHVRHVRVGDKIESSGLCVESIPVNSIIDWCYANNEFAQINRHEEDTRESAKVQAFRHKEKIGSTMCIPVSYNDKPWAVFLINKHVDKQDFNETDVNVFKAVASQISTALQRNNLLSTVQHQADHDSLTGLPNRRSFESRFSKTISVDKNEKYAIFFCDLDGFKAINDSHGHDIGDEVLNICAERMRTCIRDGDYLARMGGDEFAVLVKLTDNDRDVDRIAKRFVSSLSEPIQSTALRLQVGASIGISFYPEDGTSFSDLLNHADVAMYQAKHSGKGKVLYFNKKDAEEIRNRHEMRSDLVSALTNREFELWYQPQVSWKTLTVTGVEALIRWNHPNGMISPVKFIPIAEESGFIDPLGMWTMEEAITKLSSGVLSNNLNLKMGVNIAPPQFIDPEFSRRILSLLEKHDIEPNQLKVEITESFIMRDRETVVAHLKCLRDNGVKVAIDDFGTGYSSLSYLQDLPVDVLKIDRTFVSKLTESNYEKSIAASIIALANSLGLSTIAEGVETEQQLKLIQHLGCEVIQGYYYSKPVQAADLLATIEKIESGNDCAMAKSA